MSLPGSKPIWFCYTLKGLLLFDVRFLGFHSVAQVLKILMSLIFSLTHIYKQQLSFIFRIITIWKVCIALLIFNERLAVKRKKKRYQIFLTNHSLCYAFNSHWGFDTCTIKLNRCMYGCNRKVSEEWEEGKQYTFVYRFIDFEMMYYLIFSSDYKSYFGVKKSYLTSISKMI